MSQNKPGDIEVKAFATHQMIMQPNPFRRALRRVADDDHDDPVARAEKALAGLSGEFKNWMTIEADRLSAAWDAICSDGFTDATRGELFRAAHDIKGDAAQRAAQFTGHRHRVELGALAHDRLHRVDVVHDEIDRHLGELRRVLDDAAEAVGGSAGGREAEGRSIALDVVGGTE